MSGTAFVSYSSVDRDRVAAVVDVLVSQGIGVWFDRDAIRDSDDIVQAIDAGLAEVGCFVLFLSKSYLKSEWTRAEYSAIFYTALRDEQKIVVVQLDEDATVPPLLTARRHISWSSPKMVADRIASVIDAKTRATVELPTAGDAPVLSDETVLDWNNIQSSLLDVLVTHLLDAMSTINSAAAPIVPLNVRTSMTTVIAMYVARDIAANEMIAADLRAERDVARLAKRHVNEYQKNLVQGGLGIFSPAFQIAMEQNQEKFDRCGRILREQMQAISPRLVKRQMTS